MSVEDLLAAWQGEPPTVPEEQFSGSFCMNGASFAAWNGMSAEMEFCQFAASLTKMMQPRLVVETGVGQGFTTRRVWASLDGGVLLAHEQWDELRAGLRHIPFFDRPGVMLANIASPSCDYLERADLTILDSDPPVRSEEIREWEGCAKPGAVLLVHDTGNLHPDGTIHMQHRRLIEELGIVGRFFGNPRGAFLGIAN